MSTLSTGKIVNSDVDNSEPRWQPAQPNQSTETKLVKPRKLTRKQAAFVQHLINNPKDSASAAVRATYGKEGKPVTELSARDIASDNLTKPHILSELSKHGATAEIVLSEVLEHSRKQMYTDDRNGVNWAVNARQTADSLLDRLHGKSTQRTETVTTAVNLNLNLSDIVTEVDE